MHMNSRVYFSQFWGPESPRSSHWKVGFLLKVAEGYWRFAQNLLKKQTGVFCCVLTWQKGQGDLWTLFYKGTNTTHQGSILMILITSQSLSHWGHHIWGIVFNIGIWGNTNIQSIVQIWCLPENYNVIPKVIYVRW